MKFHKKAALFAAALITLTGIVSASPAALNLFPESSSARIDSFTSYELEVENTGPVKDVYTLSSTSTSEITIAPQKVELEPGTLETVNVWYNPEIDRDEGAHTFQITAESRATGDRFSTTGTVEVIKDHQVEVSAEDSRSVCLGENAVYNLEIENTGIQPEEFSISSDFGELSRKSVNLEDGETAEVTLTVSSEEAVERNFDVVVASKTSYAQDIENVNFEAENCYDSEVSISPGNQEVAAFTEASYQVTVRNTGTRQDEFTLSASEGQLLRTELEPGAGQTRTTTLFLTPEDVGERNIEVTAEGRSEASQTVTLQSYNGMNSEVSFSQETRRICEEDGETEYQVQVTNTGEATETFQLSSSMGELEQERIEIETGDTRTVDLAVNSSAGAGKHEVTVTSSAVTFNGPSSSSTSELTVEDCYDLQMQVVPEVASAGENRSAIYRIILNNTGTRENTYELTSEVPEWIDVQPETVELDAGATGDSYIYAGIPFEKKGEVKITARAVGTEVERTRTVDLLIGKEIEDAIEDSQNNVTGSFGQRITQAFRDLSAGRNALALAASVLVAVVVTAVILMRE